MALLLALPSCAASRPPLAALEAGEQALAAGRLDEARTDLDMAARKDPRSVQAARLQVEAHLRSGTLPTLLKALEDRERQHPDDPVAEYQFGLALFVSGEDHRAEGLLHLERAADRGPAEPEFALRLGAGLLQVGKAREARPRLENAMRLEPRQVSTRLLLASCLSQLNEPDALVDALAGLLDLEPSTADLARANKLVKQARDPLAGLEPELAARVQRAMDQAEKGDPDLALTMLEGLERQSPDVPVVEELLGVARQRSGDTRGAVAALRRAVELGPRRPQGRRYLADLYHDLGEHDLALNLYVEVVERDPFDDAARSRVASYELARGDLPGAVAQLRALSLLAPGDPVVLVRLARAHLAAADPAAAEQDLIRATKTEIPGYEPFRELGELLLTRKATATGEGRKDLSRRAQAAFEKALALRPGDLASLRGLDDSRAP